MPRPLLVVVLGLLSASLVWANPPVASYLYPAGGQRGTRVELRVGGLYLGEKCAFALEGPGITAPHELRRTTTRWFEGPLLPLPDSQRAEDYPRDLVGTVELAKDAPLGQRRGHVATAEGVAGGLTFVVGDLPEVVEEEIEGEPLPVRVRLPVTINGRIFPRQDADLWTVELRPGETITAAVQAQEFGSPLDARVEILDPSGQVLALREADGRDPWVRATARREGTHSIRISDAQLSGGPAHVYRLTVTTGPWVDAVFPLGGKRGEKVTLKVHGPNTPEGPLVTTLAAGEGAQPVLLVPGANLVTLDRDDLPETADPTTAVSPPMVLNGRIEKPGQVQGWKIALKKGVAVALEVRAARLGSRLQAALQLTDAGGKAVAQAEWKPGSGDPVLSFTPPADGEYTLHVRDRFAARAGIDFAYRVRIAAPEPGYSLKLAGESLNVERGKTNKVRLTLERRGGFADPIEATVEGLPQGVTVPPVKFEKAVVNAEIVVTATGDAPIGPVTLAVVAKSGTQSRTVPLLLGVTIPVPFKVVADYEMRWSARGSTHRRGYRIERGGYQGPIEIRLADRQARHLQGVSGPVITVPAGQDRFEYAVQLAPNMEIGRTCRVCIMATAKIKEGEREYEVSYSRAEQSDQIVTVVETGRLGIELGSEAIRAQPGGLVEVPFRLQRGKELTATVSVTLVVPDHIRGVMAEPIEVPAGRSDGVLRVRFAADQLGPFNLPLRVQARHVQSGDTTLAEAPLEILAEVGR